MFRTPLSITLALASMAQASLPPDISGFLETYCVDCHGEDLQKGKFRVDILGLAESKGSAESWGKILRRLEAGEMPPPQKQKPDVEELGKTLHWVKTGLAREMKQRRTEGRVRIRRLNRLEYENTLHDLLGIGTSLADRLPEDDLADGFSNGTEALAISPVHIHQYMETARTALEAAIVRRKPADSPVHTFSYCSEKEKSFYNHGNNKPMIRTRGDQLWFYRDTHIEVPAYLRQFSELTKARPGKYKIQVTASTDSTEGQNLVYSIWTAAGNKRRELVGHFDAHPCKPSITEIERWFEPGQSIIIAPYRLEKARMDIAGLSKYQPQPDLPKDWKGDGKFYEPVGPALVVAPVKITGPLYGDSHPPGQQTLFGDLPMVPNNELVGWTVPRHITKWNFRVDGQWQHALTVAQPDDPVGKARELLLLFAQKAFRREVQEKEIQPYLDIVSRKTEEKLCFESALLPAYQALLCSPHFLFLVEEPGPLSGHALANRLSYFLWRSMPDGPLLELARHGKLQKKEVLLQQAARMLDSRKSSRFIHDFLDHWLNLREIDATTPDRQLFPDYFTSISSGTIDAHLHESVLAEPRATFSHALGTNRDFFKLFQDDHTFLNARLAEHYGIPGPAGTHFRRHAVPPASHLGGILTQAAVMKVTANGANTSPVIRGNWILERILGQPAPPPPPDAGSIEPDTRGATTIREQLLKHKDSPSCASCHHKIDPPGFAMEAFNPVGQFREFYRSSEVGEKIDKKVWVGGYRKVQYLKGPAVDATGSTPEGHPFTNPTEFKQTLLQQKKFLARNLAAQLLTFSTGKHPEPGDTHALDNIVNNAATQANGLRDLLLEVILSELFRNK